MRIYIRDIFILLIDWCESFVKFYDINAVLDIFKYIWQKSSQSLFLSRREEDKRQFRRGQHIPASAARMIPYATLRVVNKLLTTWPTFRNY